MLSFRLVFLFLLAAARLASAQEPSWTPTLAAAADSLIAAQMEEDQIPGAALVVVEDGVVAHRKAYGLADLDRGLPVDVDRTLFRIGSVTKALTALALLGLAERDRIVPLVALVRRANEQWEAAAADYASLSARDPGNGAYAYWEGYAALSGGDPERAIDAFERARAAGKWPAWSRYYVAASHAAMRHPDIALEILEQALDEGFSDPGLLASEPWWDSLRGHPRFSELESRLDS
ncbi:MAG TPA: serine hydrolase [Gemmatimonadota bacterium]|nr:serine hydrolase [Gemmatimonadota bacterium]